MLCSTVRGWAAALRKEGALKVVLMSPDVVLEA